MVESVNFVKEWLAEGLEVSRDHLKMYANLQNKIYIWSNLSLCFFRRQVIFCVPLHLPEAALMLFLYLLN